MFTLRRHLTNFQSGRTTNVHSLAVTAAIACLLLLPSCRGCGEQQDNQSTDTFEGRSRLSQLGIQFGPEGFVKAVSDGDAMVVDLFLKAGIDPNTEFDVAEFVQKQGGKPTVEGIKAPVLLIAQLKGKQDVVQRLISAGASVEKAAQAQQSIESAEKESNNLNREIYEGLKDVPEVMPGFMQEGIRQDMGLPRPEQPEPLADTGKPTSPGAAPPNVGSANIGPTQGSSSSKDLSDLHKRLNDL